MDNIARVENTEQFTIEKFRYNVVCFLRRYVMVKDYSRYSQSLQFVM